MTDDARAPTPPPRADLRRRVLAGEPTIGAFVTFGAPISAELMSRIGFDWLIVDLEHGHGTEADLLPQLHAIQLTSTAALVRVVSASSLEVKVLKNGLVSNINQMVLLITTLLPFSSLNAGSLGKPSFA